MNNRRISRKFGILARFIVLAILIAALLPALPAAAAEPAHRDRHERDQTAKPAQDGVVAEQGEVNAAALTLSSKKVYPADGGNQFYFGLAISVQGDLMLIGAPGEDVDAVESQGAAYLYGRNVGGPGQWGLIKRVLADDGVKQSRFGEAVAVYGTTAVVCAQNHNSGQGACYVFEKDAGGSSMWGQARQLTANDGDSYEYFGASVAIYGSTIVVGATNVDVNGKPYQGAAYVFGRNIGGPANWGQVKKLTASDGDADNYFGESVAINAGLIVVGAPQVDVGGYEDAGAAYIFSRDVGGDNHWGEIKKLVASDPGKYAYFGKSVGVSGNTVVVGADTADVYGNTDQGAAYVFERNTGGFGMWGQVKKLVAPDGTEFNLFGYSVAISGSAIVVGAPASGPVGGAAYLFGRNTTGVNEWGLITRLDVSDLPPYAFFGRAVSVDNVTIAVGAPEALVGNNRYPGMAYVFVPFGLRVNSAGPKYIDKAGNLWVADRSWLPGQPVTPGTTPWGYTGGIGRVVSSPISNTEDDKLYQSERLYTGAVKPGYKFVVPNGRYMLAFKYAETYWSAAGKRKFSIMAEKQICFSNYDPFIGAGGAKNKAAPDKVCYVNVTDGELDIDFISVVGQAKADAIYIQQVIQ